MNVNNYIDRLKEIRFKTTPRRKAVIELFLKRDRYIGPSEVRSLLKNKFRYLGLPSIYRILEELKGAGILIRIEKDRKLYYALCKVPVSHHHHFICRKCRKVEDLKYCNFKNISKLIEKKLNGKAESHFLQIEGLCSVCK